MARLTATILGCGSSGGVPRLGPNWGDCDPANPKKRRRRCSLLLRREDAGGTTEVLIDTSPDLRDQLLDAGVSRLDAVVYTHAHADHIHGIDDLRGLAIKERKRIDVYLDQPTSARAHKAFDYCFVTPPGSGYPPILTEHRLHSGVPVTVTGAGGTIGILPFLQHHGEIDSLGFRIGPLAYLPDVADIPDAAWPALEGLDCWIVDALRRTPHPTHAHLAKTLDWIARAAPARAVLTNMHVDMDYQTLCKDLPTGVIPGHDGLRLDFII